MGTLVIAESSVNCGELGYTGWKPMPPCRDEGQGLTGWKPMPLEWSHLTTDRVLCYKASLAVTLLDCELDTLVETIA